VFADFPLVKKSLFYTSIKGVIWDFTEAAVYLTKSSFSWDVHIVTIYQESEAGHACIKKEYFLIRSKQIVHGETYYYCKGFVSEQSIKIDYMHQDKTYSVKGETLEKIVSLLKEIHEGDKSKFDEALSLLGGISRADSLLSQTKRKLDDWAYWKSGKVNIDGVSVRLSPSENGNYITSEFIK